MKLVDGITLLFPATSPIARVVGRDVASSVVVIPFFLSLAVRNNKNKIDRHETDEK